MHVYGLNLLYAYFKNQPIKIRHLDLILLSYIYIKFTFKNKNYFSK